MDICSIRLEKILQHRL